MTATNPSQTIPDAERLIYALDGMTLEAAVRAVRSLSEAVHLFKIGPSLVYEGGLDAARQLARAGGDSVRIFLDMKSWDIPETVLATLDAVERYGGEAVVFVTIHTYSLNFKRLLAEQRTRRMKIFAITLLTSQDQGDLEALGIRMAVEDYVVYMAKRARDFGCDGIVCSGLEAPRIRAELGPDLRLIVPGVRPAWAAVPGDDQKRVVTPAQAMQGGADHIVVGRPIRQAADPLRAAREILREIREGLDARDR